jgi:hypothetical protein
MRVQDAAMVRYASVSCNVKIVSGARTNRIESAYARVIIHIVLCEANVMLKT